MYTFTTPKLSPVVQETAGRELIQSCLNAPEPGDLSNVGNDSNQGDQSQGSSEQDELVIPDFTNGLSSHTHQHQQSHHDPYADPFQDPRNGFNHNNNNNNHMSNINLNMPHLNGLSYGGYPGHHMNVHEQSIPYGSYGL